jgi:DNA-directed RNA polymerase specialized sigma54-like protein
VLQQQPTQEQQQQQQELLAQKHLLEMQLAVLQQQQLELQKRQQQQQFSNPVLSPAVSVGDIGGGQAAAVPVEPENAVGGETGAKKKKLFSFKAFKNIFSS